MTKETIVLPLHKAAWKAWEEYDPEFSVDAEGVQQLHTEGKEALFNYDDVEETFLDGFIAGVEHARSIKRED